MPGVQVGGLTKRFHAAPVVDNISFDVPSGTFTTLLGPSGCGKTTTLRMLAGFERPDAGTVTIADKVVASGSSSRYFVPPESRNVGVVFQSYALWPHMTANQQVAYPLQVRKMKPAQIRDRVRSALSLVGLGTLGGKYPSQLSGGQQQRIALARALVFEPSILLLDEPLSNLDAELRKQMRDELAGLHQRLGITFVYVTHDQSEALALSDQILVMRLGHIVERGSPAEVYTKPASAYAAQFVGAANCITATLTEVSDGVAVAHLTDGAAIRGHAAGLGPDAVGRRVVVAIKPEDIELAPGEAAGGNEVSGVVRGHTYLGSHVEVVVEASAQSLNVHIAKWKNEFAGAAVRLRLPEESVRIVAGVRD